MGEEKKTNEKKNSAIKTALSEIVTGENIQKYILGTKKSGQPRAVYDIVKAYTKPKKKKKKKYADNSYELMLELKNGKKKKKKKKKNNDKFWHI